MSASQPSTSEEVQNLLQSIVKSSTPEYPAKRCSDSTTPERSCEPCMRLEAIDVKLYAKVEEVNELLKIRAEVKEHVNQRHDYVTRHLPPEITSHIFAIYTENFNSNFNPLSPAIEYCGPLRLGAVSNSWRKIAFGTPHLWTTVNIAIPQTTNNLPRKVELTQQWLDRSRQLPLYLSLICENSDGLTFNALSPLFEVLRAAAPRWHILTLGISPAFYTRFLGELTCAPTLDTLTLFTPTNDLDEDGEFHLPDTPSLKNLDLGFGCPLFDVYVDWGNLTTLKATDIRLGEFFEVLRLVEGLNSFSVRTFHQGPEDNPLPTTPFTHSVLKQLYLDAGDEIEVSELETLLDLAVFPSLEKFGYESSHRFLFPNDALPSLFNRSHCHLTHFDLTGELQDATSEDLISILSDLPTVTHLKLEDPYSWFPESAIMSDQLLRRLTPNFGGEVTQTRLLPRLESLEFRGRKAFSWSCLADLVSGTATPDGGIISLAMFERQRSANSIRCISFRVYFEGETEFIDVHSVARFKGACNAGISIIIERGKPPYTYSLHGTLDAYFTIRDQPVDLLP